MSHVKTSSPLGRIRSLLGGTPRSEPTAEPEKTSRAPAPKAREGNAICRRCMGPVPGGARRCGGCGAPVQASASGPRPAAAGSVEPAAKAVGSYRELSTLTDTQVRILVGALESGDPERAVEVFPGADDPESEIRFGSEGVCGPDARCALGALVSQGYLAQKADGCYALAPRGRQLAEMARNRPGARELPQTLSLAQLAAAAKPIEGSS